MNTFSSSLASTFSAVRRQPIATKSAALRRRYIRHVAILATVGVLAALTYVWIRIQVIQLGYEVSRLRKETTDLKEERNLIKAEVEALKSPSRLEVIARERFGMRLPQGDEIVFVDRDTK